MLDGKTTALSNTTRLYTALLPEHLHQTTGERSSYKTRHVSHYTPFKCNTETYKYSFYPKTTSDWNHLSLHMRSARSLHKFKRLLTRHRFRPPIWYYHDSRVTNILLCQIRKGCSPLCDDLFNNHITDNPMCAQCKNPETGEHYFLHCNKYKKETVVLFNDLTKFISVFSINTRLLLFGDTSLPSKTNINIVNLVRAYTKNTRRLLHRKLALKTSIGLFQYCS